MNRNEKIINSDPWYIIIDGFDPIREREIESLLSLGNGYVGTRNSLEEYYKISDPATFTAGIYDVDPEYAHIELLRLPNWTRIQIYINHELTNLIDDNPIMHRRYLDIKKGLYVREWRTEDSVGRITNIKIIKFISLNNKHELGKSISITPENYSGKIKIVSGIDGRNLNSPYLTPEIAYPRVAYTTKFISIALKTRSTNKIVDMTQRSEFIQNNQKISLSPFVQSDIIYSQEYENGFIKEEWEWDAEIGRPATINSLVVIYTSIDHPNPIEKSKAHLADLDDDFFNKSLNNHLDSWKKHLANAKLIVTGNDIAQRQINFAIYHLIISGKFSGKYFSIPARNLNGPAYKGHIFWDTEIYLLPFFIFTDPDVARNLLLYRYNTLPGARENAKNENLKGASYAWESAETGQEVTPPHAILPNGEIIRIYSGEFEVHITPDIAYAVWQYWQATHDEDFLLNYGAEIIFETAKMCMSLLKQKDDGLYHIDNVIGPDEYHELVDDNAYTNHMVQFNLETAIKTKKIFESKNKDKFEELKKKINLSDTEINTWNEVKDRIYTGFDEKTKIFEQFKGFFNLEYIDLKKYEPRSVPMDLILGRERTRNSQVIKQADVLMFLFLLGSKFNKEILKINFDYYTPRTGQGSSLSPSIHSIIAARHGNLAEAYKFFTQNANIDLNDVMGNAAAGIHIASLGGVWLSSVMGFGGMYIYDEGLLFDPNLPDEWEKLEFCIKWRKQKINVVLDKNEIQFSISGNQKVNLSVGDDNWREFDANQTFSAYKTDRWYWK